MYVTNEESMSNIITVKQKEDDDIFVDKVIEDNDNIREVLAISKEPLGNEVKEITDTIEAAGETKVDVEEDSKKTSQRKITTSLEETAKVKDLEKIIVDNHSNRYFLRSSCHLLQMKLVVLIVKMKSRLTMKEIST